MVYDQSIFSRSFRKKELRKVGCGALLICFLMGFTFRTISDQPLYSHVEIAKSIYNLSSSKSDAFEITGDIRIHGNSSTIFIASSPEGKLNSWTTKPYARKGDNYGMEYVRTWKIKNVPENLPDCSKHFSIPAIVFSTGGYCGNHFHDFTDMIIPLFLTARQFHGTVLFLIADKRSSWISKYRTLLEKLSNYDIIEIEKENQVMCFVRAIVGLKAHKELGIDPLQSPHYSMSEFRQFLRSTYSLDRQSVIDCRPIGCSSRPRMLIVSRKQNRFITNENEVANEARSLGFDVVVEETGSNVSVVARFVNSFDVMVGVHGAGLTNMVFLPENGVVVQIIPFGAELWAKPYFRLPAKDMKLRYLEYKVSLNESSLLGKYAVDSEVYRDPSAIYKKGFIGFHSVYLSNQNVTLNFCRFRKTLLKVMEIIQH
ncbi:Alpha-1,3-arabinosyltransferase XAT3 [Sesamum alatum]|uniref:Alpha-1,3-arabinosyltransferase XAT3 n=1 Tax=Sesamum alatum TaxID=300844 RepID=A0AAE2CWA9_9LAMI|nr:Alpha-1,3-arabinosyltransferase XAT3 [Sesamum alatum]